MDFSGDLSVLEPATLFQLFNMSRLTGMLKFITKDNNASFYFKEGELIYATIDTRKKKIGRFLIEKEWITEEQLNEALVEFTSKGGIERIGHILIDKGYLDYDSLATVIQEQMKEVVYDVLPWKQCVTSLHKVLTYGADFGDVAIEMGLMITFTFVLFIIGVVLYHKKRLRGN